MGLTFVLGRAGVLLVYYSLVLATCLAKYQRAHLVEIQRFIVLQPLCDDKCDGPTEFSLLTTQHARHGAPITLDNVVWASDERDYAAVAAPSKGGDMVAALAR